MFEKNAKNLASVIFLLLPITIIIGPALSLISILLLNIIFIILLRNIDLPKFNLSINLLLVLFLYLILNIFLSENKVISLSRNIGFFRFIILFLLINYFFDYFFNQKKILRYWFLIIAFVIFDVYFEFFFGKNIFGWGARFIDGVEQPNGRRIVSFFKDEPIVGSYLNGFIFIIAGFLFNEVREKKKKFIPILFLFASFFALLFTGERSNTLKFIIGLSIIFIFIDNVSVKKKLQIFSLIFLITILAVSNIDYLKNRYFGLIKIFDTKEKIEYQFKNNLYLRLYKSGYSVFKNNYLFGVGNKNYRIVTCNKENSIKYDYKCMTHPHQIYFEILSEHGLIGSIIIFGIFFYLMFRVLKEILITRNMIQICCFSYVFINFIPILPSGSFFSDFNSTLFWLNFSIMFASNQKTNIFKLR